MIKEGPQSTRKGKAFCSGDPPRPPPKVINNVNKTFPFPALVYALRLLFLLLLPQTQKALFEAEKGCLSDFGRPGNFS